MPRPPPRPVEERHGPVTMTERAPGPRDRVEDHRSPSQARLESERDDLLRAIRDLDREHEFGDLSDEDHERLRARYTVAAADVLRRLSSKGEGSSGARSAMAASPLTEDGERSVRAGTGTRTWMVVLGVLVFAVVSGVMVARSSGQRGSNAITGSQGSLRDQLSTCQPLAFSDPDKGVECYSAILEKAPDNLEALTYQGWAMVRAGRIEGAGTNFAKVVEIDPSYPDVRVFRAVVAVRARDFTTAAEELDEFYRNDPSDMAVQVLQSQGLEREVFFGLQPEAVRNCWQKAAEAGGDSDQLDAAFYSTLGTCLDTTLVQAPGDVDALVSRAFAAAGTASLSGGSTIEAATPFLDAALGIDPVNANALVLRAGLRAVNGSTDAALDDLDALDRLGHPTISFLSGSPAQIRSGL